MYVYTLAAIGIVSFFLFGDKKRIRELYPCMLFIVLGRFTEQYIYADMLELWTYDKLPTPVGRMMDIPVLIDLFFYPFLGFLIIQYLPHRRLYRLLWVLGWALLFAGNEYLAKRLHVIVYVAQWKWLYSFFLYLAAIFLTIAQYELYRNKRRSPAEPLVAATTSSSTSNPPQEPIG